VLGVSIGAGIVAWRRTRRLQWGLLVVSLGGAAGVLVALLWSDVDPQTQATVRRLHERGYADVTVTKIAGMGHEPATERVLATCDAMRGAP
jgi:hypothetical protein